MEKIFVKKKGPQARFFVKRLRRRLMLYVNNYSQITGQNLPSLINELIIS